MSHRIVVSTSITCILLLIGAFFLVRDDAEPQYHGRSLSDWVALRYSAGEIGMPWFEGNRPANLEAASDQAEEAIRQIGTNAIPHLLKWFAYVPSHQQQHNHNSVNRGLHCLDAKLKTHWFIANLKCGARDQVLGYGSIRAFSVLGDDAKTAIPELTRIVSASIDDPSRSDRATWALAYLGHLGLHTTNALFAPFR